MKIGWLHRKLQRSLAVLIVAAGLLAHESSVAASPRDEAERIVTRLRSVGAAKKAPDELKSIEKSYSFAEEFKKKKFTEIAERFYLLTIQKAKILEAKLKDAEGGAAETVNQAAGDAALTGPDQPVFTALIDEAIIVDGQPSQEEADKEAAAPGDGASDKFVGTISTYTVKPKENLRLIAAKLGVNRHELARMNKIDLKKPLKPGQQLTYNNRKIIPQQMKNGIVINIPDRTLYYFRQGKLALSLPVAVGLAEKTKKTDWTTPTGRFKITAKAKDPTWHVPPSIQSEMDETGKEVQTVVPPGPTNPLGRYAIRTSIPGIMIHSTTSPASIYSFSSHGCIRLYPEHMVDFFKEIKVNTPGEIIYQPVKLAVTESGRVFLEVHQDPYKKMPRLDHEAKLQIERNNLSDRVDWDKVEAVVKRRAGIAEDVTL